MTGALHDRQRELEADRGVHRAWLILAGDVERRAYFADNRKHVRNSSTAALVAEQPRPVSTADGGDGVRWRPV